VKLEPGALIRGDLIAYGPSPPEVSPESRVLGRIQYHAEGGEGGEAASFAWRWLFAFLALLVLGAATIVVSARWGERVAAEIGRRFGASLLSGFVALIVVPLLVALLAVTVVGIPLAVLVIALYAVVLLLSGVFVSLRLGDWMLGKAGRPRASPYAQLAAGALLVSLLAALPWIGWIAWLLVPVIGLGAILLERKDAWRRRSTGAPA
jgi:hypothetical protein